MDKQRSQAARIALLWRGSPEERRTATVEGNRLNRVAAALADQGLAVEPAVYCEELQDEVRDRLQQLDGVLVWVNPLADGRDRSGLDAMLREVAMRGVWVSTHPDVILQMGTKEVLHRTRSLGWGSDCHLYRSADQLRDQLPARLVSHSVRVLKRNRGNAGQGVWKVQLAEREAHRVAPVTVDTLVEVLQAERGSISQRLRLGDFLRILRVILRARRLRAGSSVSAPAARGHDPLLHGARTRGGLWSAASTPPKTLRRLAG